MTESNQDAQNAESHFTDGGPTKLPNVKDEVGRGSAGREAERLYSLCLDVLQYLCMQISTRSSGNSTKSARLDMTKLHHQLQKLFLWGEAFESGQLDRALQQSEQSRSIVMELLRNIGDTIFYGALQQSSSCPPCYPKK